MAVKVAFIGLKGHWYAVAEDLPKSPEAEWVAVADDNADQLKRVPDFPGATSSTRTYGDWRELLDKEKPDVVVECDIDRDRAEIVLACAERGINIIAEKPLAKTLAELERVSKAVQKSGKTSGKVAITGRVIAPDIALDHKVEGEIDLG